MRTFAKIVAALAAAFYLAFGIWAFAAPESFAENIANFPPYSRHLVHDLGVFGIGLGVAAAAGLLLSDALVAALAAVAAGSLMHGVSHILDQELGGRSSDPWTVSLTGVVTLLAFVAAVTTRGARSSAHRPPISRASASRPEPVRATHVLDPETGGPGRKLEDRRNTP